MHTILNSHEEFQKSIYKETLQAFPGVIEGLKKLDRKGIKLGIVSSRTRPSVDRYLKHIGIYKHFKLIVTPENTEKHKPNPQPVEWALAQLNSKKEETLFIGDATFDIESGNAAGVDTALVSWSHNPIHEMKIKPTYILNSFDELYKKELF